MSYYTDLAFVVAFDDKEKLTAWLCAVVLDMQEQVEWYGTEKDSAGFNRESTLIDVFRMGGYRKYDSYTNDLVHTFTIESSFKNLPWAVETRLQDICSMASLTGGGGGYYMLGEDGDDQQIYATDMGGFDMDNYFEIVRELKQTNDSYVYDGGELLKTILGA